jgi:glycosyltransferase involved in cell wall biosynthesis
VATSGGRLERALTEAGGELVPMPVESKNPLVMWANAGRLARLIRERRIALVHARSRAPAWSALLATRRCHIPFVTTYHGIYQANGPLKRWYNSVMAKGDTVIANSQWTADHVRRAYAPKRLVTIPRGIDLAYFDPSTVGPERVEALRARWHVADGDRIVLLPGRLSRWKGQLVLLAALDLLRKSGRLPKDVRVVIAGDAQTRDTYREELKNAIAHLELQGAASIEDHIEDMPAAYCAADMVVSASTDPEAFGRVPPEAAAMGEPVIATDHGGARETVLNGETGLLVAPGDAPAMADALADLLTRPREALAAMGEKGRAHIVRNFSLERMCAETLAVYRALIEAK